MFHLGFLQRVLERLHAVAAEGVVGADGGDGHSILIDRRRVGDRILRGIASGAEDIAVPFVARDRIGHGRLDDQDLLVFLGYRQHRQRHAGRGRADGDVGLVVLERRLEQGLAYVGLALVVFQQHYDLVAVDLHRAAGRVIEAQHEAGLGLLGIGFEEPGLVGDQGNFDIFGMHGARNSNGAEHGQGGQKVLSHVPDPLMGWWYSKRNSIPHALLTSIVV